MNFKLSRNSSLIIDGIRFIAAEMVVVGHGLWDFNFYKWFAMHDLAVLIFFILSGFLISYSLLAKIEDARYSFKEYFIDRFSRIYSALVPCLLIIVVLDLLYLFYFRTDYKYADTLNVKTFLGNIFMLQDNPVLLNLKYFFMASNDSFLYISSFGSGRPLWSLAVEWWMYMSFGWLFLKQACAAKGKYYLILLLLSIVSIYNCFSGTKTEGLAVVWIFGCIVTAMLNKNSEIKNVKNGILAFLFFTLAILTILKSRSGYGILTASLFTLSFYFLILWSNNLKVVFPSYLSKFIKLGSGFSFTLYLLHYSVLEFALVSPQNTPIVRFFLYVIVSNVLSLIVAYFTEMRYKEFSTYLKRKFIKEYELVNKTI